jgi:hypothetical protein
MKTSKVISGESQEHFWRVVRRCLREFHDASPAVLARVGRLRQRIDEAPIEEIEIFFHGEPFFVACNLARCQLSIEDFLEPYLEIRDGRDNHRS